MASIISIAAGSTPAAMIADTASPAASTVWKPASRVRTASGRGSSRSVTSGRHAERALAADEGAHAGRSPGYSTAAATELLGRPSGSTTSSPVTWFTVKPYLRQCAPPEFSATLPPMVHADWLDGSGA